MIELLVCTLIWGASFVAQKLGADHFGPFSINCYRNILAGLFLYGCIRLRDRYSARRLRATGTTLSTPSWNRASALGASASGVCLFAAMLSQQLGIERTGPGVSAFLTANYVLFVPVLSVSLGRSAGWTVWAGVGLSLFGSSLICFTDFRTAVTDFHLGAGESWTLLCAALFAVQILVVDRFARNCDMLRFSMVQMLVAGLVALPFVFLPGEMVRASWGGFAKGLPSLVWLGVVSSGVAYTLQNLGQAKVPAALASIVMSMEGAFAVLFGWLILGDVLTGRQMAGCGVILAAVLMSQLIPSAKRLVFKQEEKRCGKTPPACRRSGGRGAV